VETSSLAPSLSSAPRASFFLFASYPGLSRLGSTGALVTASLSIARHAAQHRGFITVEDRAAPVIVHGCARAWQVAKPRARPDHRALALLHIGTSPERIT
jgi:hypothetical protein